MAKMKKIIIALCVVLLFGGIVEGQDIAVKTNLLYDLTLTPNLSLEMGIAPRGSVELYGGWNPSGFNIFPDDVKWNHYLLRLEWRYWLCERFYGHFLGLHALFAHYNVGGVYNPVPTPLGGATLEKAYRYGGNSSGAGLSWGYQLPLSLRWSLEFSLGAGAWFVDDKRYDCVGCGAFRDERKQMYFGPTHAAISLVYFAK